MKLNDYIKFECIEVNCRLTDKSSIIEYIVELSLKSGQVNNYEIALRDVLEREKVLSTGIGKGLALPHAKTSAVNTFVVSLITLLEPVEYDSLDSEPVKLVILMLGPEGNIGMNLKILSKISRLLGNESIKNAIINASSKQEIFELISNYED